MEAKGWTVSRPTAWAVNIVLTLLCFACFAMLAVTDFQCRRKRSDCLEAQLSDASAAITHTFRDMGGEALYQSDPCSRNTMEDQCRQCTVAVDGCRAGAAAWLLPMSMVLSVLSTLSLCLLRGHREPVKQLEIYV